MEDDEIQIDIFGFDLEYNFDEQSLKQNDKRLQKRRIDKKRIPKNAPHSVSPQKRPVQPIMFYDGSKSNLNYLTVILKLFIDKNDFVVNRICPM